VVLLSKQAKYKDALEEPIEEEGEITITEAQNSDEKIKDSRIALFFTENKTGKFLFSTGKSLFPFVTLFLLAEAIIGILYAAGIDTGKLPPMPHDVIVFAWQSFFPGEDSSAFSLWIHIGTSFLKVIEGFAIGVIAGLLVGILMGLSVWLFRLLNPIFSLLISIPTLAWVPVLVVVIGINNATILTTISLSCFFPMVYSTSNGMRSIDKNLIWAARIMGASKFEIFYDVLLPGALLSIIAGLRLGIGYAWRAIVGAELIVALLEPIGIGYFMSGGLKSVNSTQIIVAVFLIALGGLLLDAVLMKPLEHFTIKKWGAIKGAGAN